jgi:hypothetical protein
MLHGTVELVLRDHVAAGAPVTWLVDAVSAWLPIVRVSIFDSKDLGGPEPL